MGLNKVAIILIVLLGLFIVAFTIEVIYVLWGSRRFRRRTLTTGGDPEFSGDTVWDNRNPSKELLYFFCWKAQNRITPNGALADTRPPELTPADADDVLKWHEARVLFTIKEEEKEGVESEKQSEERLTEKRETSEECLTAASYPSEVTVDFPVSGDEDIVMTPYYTPMPSPLREANDTGAVSVLELPELGGSGGEVVVRQ